MASSNSPQLHDPREWRRVGGRELQFFAADDELQTYLHALPEEFGPYDTVGETVMENPAGPHPYRSEFFAAPIDEHFERLRRGKRIPMNIFILQHGLTRHGKREASRIAISDKIANQADERVELRSQRTIFASLRRRITKDLAYASILVSTDGHEVEDTLQCMTAAAAELARQGVFDRRPGRRMR